MRKVVMVLVVWILATTGARAEVVTGCVVGPHGEPIAGAAVVIVPEESGKTGKQDILLQSDAEGNFSTEMEPVRGHVRGDITVYKAGLAPSFGWLHGGRWGEVNDDRNPVVRLVPGQTIGGIMRDANGQPVANVTVRLEMIMVPFLPSKTGALIMSYGYLHSSPSRALMSRRLDGPVREHFQTTTGTDGRWSLDDVPLTGQAYFQVEGENRASAYTLINLQLAKMAGIHLIAEPEAVIKGRVIYEGGEPVANVEVRARSDSRGYQDETFAQTGADGTYQLGALKAGSYTVDAASPAPGWLLVQSEKVTTQASHISEASPLILTRGATIEGRVVDAQTNAGVVGVGIGIDNNMSSSIGVQGRYSINLKPGKHTIYISNVPPSHLMPVVGSPVQPITVTLQKAETQTLDFKLERSLTLRGDAVDEKHHPVPAVSLSLGVERNHILPYYFNPPRDLTDMQGQWTMKNLVPGPYVVRVVGTAGKPPGWQVVGNASITLPHAGPVHVVLRRIAPVLVSGRVVTPQGHAVANARITAHLEYQPSHIHLSVFPPAMEPAVEPLIRHVQSDAAGRFVVGPMLPDYQVALQVNKPGYRYLSGGKVTKQGEHFVVSDIVMEQTNGKVPR